MERSIFRFDAPGDGFVLTQNPEMGCFDCNICLDSAHDPVVTLCGHLFCWPCIYRWLHVQKSSQQNCPVCKSNISIAALVPLYGRGLSSSHTRIIPPRPTSPPLNLQHHRHQAQSSPRHYGGFSASNHLANAVMMSFLYPVIGMFGDMVYTRFTNTLPHPYQHAHGNNQRMLLLDKSLHRVSIFFLCCILLCLLFF